MVRLTAFLMLLLSQIACAQECVVLLHGLGRTAWSMRQIETALEKSGYQVVNQSYIVPEKSIDELAKVVGDGIYNCQQNQPTAIHFVTHSLGGILVRMYFQHHPVNNVERVVMLGPPNRGSEIIDRYKGNWWFRWLTGSAAQQLGTAPNSLPNQLKPIPLEIGVIAGYTTSDPWYTSLFNGTNDGKVSVNNTKLPEMKDFIQVESGHTFMANSRNVIAQIQSFLISGYFIKPNTRIASTSNKGA